MDLALPKLNEIIAECWARAEEKTIQAVAEKYPAIAEEQITFLFGGELRTAVAQASARNEFATAFLADIESQFPDVSANSLSGLGGLIAQVNLHNRWHEGHRSAADMGIVINRPSLFLAASDLIQVIRDRSQGLLVQAKLGQATSEDTKMKWRTLTPKQQKLIPAHERYYTLLLYRLRGSSKTDLGQFGWQLCGGHTVREIKDWLSRGTFPNETRSAEVIRNLGVGSIGTADPCLIERYIDPKNSQTSAIEIRVFWPDGEGPQEFVSVRQETSVVVQVRA
jgi:hypothetical protein